MTYLWRIPETNSDGLIGTYLRSNGLDRFELRKGKRIKVNEAMPTVQFDERTHCLLAFDCLSNTAAPLISQRMAQVLLDICAQDVQLVPARIEAADGVLDGWSLLNAIATVRAINHSKSVYTMVPGTQAIMGFRHLEFLEDCLVGHQIARDTEYLGHLLVSDSLAQALSDFSGATFERPEEAYHQREGARTQPTK